MFYDNLKAICDQKGLKVSPTVVECGGALGSIGRWKKGAYPNSDIVIKLSERLNVSIDYLLTGKESSKSDLSKDEQDVLATFNQLSERNKGMAIGYMQGLAASDGGAVTVGKDIPDVTSSVNEALAKPTNTD